MTAGAFLGRRLRLGDVSWPLWAPLVVAGYWALPWDWIADTTPLVGLWDDVTVAALLGVFTLRRGSF